jgi:hypothetical protein
MTLGASPAVNFYQPKQAFGVSHLAIAGDRCSDAGRLKSRFICQGMQHLKTERRLQQHACARGARKPSIHTLHGAGGDP